MKASRRTQIQTALRDCSQQGQGLLLRPHDSVEVEPSGDFDILIFNKLEDDQDWLEQLGQPLLEIKRTYVHQRFYDWGQIDVLPSLEWNGFSYADISRVQADAVTDASGIKRPRLGHDGVISWLTSLLWGGFYKEKYDELITRAALEDSKVMEEALVWALGKNWGAEMMGWARVGEASESQNYVAEIRRALKFQNLRRELGETQKRVVRHWVCELKHHLSPKLPTLAFLGPDGSGKSSVIGSVCEDLSRIGLGQKLLHWRPFGLKGRDILGQPVTDPHSSPPRSRGQSLAKLVMLFGDWWLASLTVLRHSRAKQSVVIFDRFYQDLVVDPVRYRYGASLKIARRVFRFFPKPDLVFVLVGSSKVIHPRKREVTEEVLEKQLTEYRTMARSLGSRAVLVDVDRPLDEVSNEVSIAVRKYLSGQTVGRGSGFPTRPIRVAQFVPHYPSMEGISSYCRGLSREMNEILPGSCPIISLRPKLDHELLDEEILHYPHDSPNPMSLPPALLADLKSDKHRLSGIVFHGPYHPKVAMLRKFLVSEKIPYIFVPHDPYVPELTRHRVFRKFAFWHLFEKQTIARAEAVQILAREHEDHLRRRGFTVPVEEIPNGCELGELSQISDVTRIPGKSEVIRIQYMGRMDRNHKGLDLLILGFSKFVAENPAVPVELILTGNDWEDRAELEALANKSGRPERIIFTGPRPEHSLVIHSEADLVILPSRFDGFGLTIVEAMLASRPVLVSRKAGVADHVQRAGGGWIFEPTPTGIKEALASAIEGRENWSELGDQNHQYVVNHLTWAQTAQKTLEMYRQYF